MGRFVIEGEASGRFQMEEPKPIRYMDEPSAMERVIGNINWPDWLMNLRGTAPMRIVQGAADPMIGGMQSVANLLPDETGIPQAVNKRVADLERDYEAQRKARGSEGLDVARFAGNVVSPVNVAIAMKAPVAVTTAGRAAQGAAIGAGTAAMQPVVDADERGFGGAKSGQVLAGTVGGAVLSPVFGKVGDLVARRLSANAAAQQSTEATDQAIEAVLRDFGQTLHDVPPAQLEALRDQVAMALGRGKSLDAAALMRKADFDALGMQGTLGQITRDPMQFAREKNLRGVTNLGEPLTDRFTKQGQQLLERLPGSQETAKDAYSAGTQLIDSLKNTDEKLRRHVSGLYSEARASANKDLDVPLQGLAQDYAQVLSDFGDKIPAAVRQKFESLGLGGGTQARVFNFDEADKLLKNINDHVGNDAATNRALGRLRDAVKSSLRGVDDSGGPFAPAVKAAAERFKMHEAIPALEAAARGDVAPDDFVRRFVIGGKTDQVKGLAQVLKTADPDSFQEARAQIADELKRAAFGLNPAGDASVAFSPTRYMETIRRLGPDKLGAFFNPQELQDIMRVGRVGAYMQQVPNAAAVNFSNTAGAAANLLSRIPVVRDVAPVAIRAAGAVNDQRRVRSALEGSVPTTDVPLDEARRNFLRWLLGGGAAIGGAAAGFAAGQ